MIILFLLFILLVVICGAYGIWERKNQCEQTLIRAHRSLHFKDHQGAKAEIEKHYIWSQA